MLFGQHDVKFIAEGLPGEGHLMVFDNDILNPDNKMPSMWAALGNSNSPEIQIPVGDFGNYSAVYEWDPPVDSVRGLYPSGRTGP